MAVQPFEGRGKLDDDRASYANEQRIRILSAAAAETPIHGIEKVRLRDVARRAGVSIGLLQHYFDSRDELVRETCRWASRKRLQEWREAAEGIADPWDRITALVRHVFLDPDFEHYSVLWLEFCGASSRDAELREEMSEVYQQWREPVRAACDDGVERGMFKPKIPIEDIVDLIMMAMDGGETATAASASNMQPRRLCKLLLEQARTLLGVTAAPAAKEPDLNQRGR